MTESWHSTCSKIPNNHNITHDDKKHQTSKALHYILGGNGWQSCCASNIKCLSCSRKTKSTECLIAFNTNCSIPGLRILRHTKKLQKLPKMTKSVKTPKALLFILGGKGWQSCCASNIKCLSCSRKTRSTTFVTLFNTNYFILGLRMLKYTKKLQKLPKMTKSVKTPKALHFIRGGNGWQSCCGSNIKCLSFNRKTKSTKFVTLFNTNYSILGLQVLKYTKKITKITQDDKSHQNPKALLSYWVGTAASRTVLAI